MQGDQPKRMSLIQSPPRYEEKTMTMIASISATVGAIFCSLVFWPTLYGVSLAAHTLVDVFTQGDRFLLATLWVAGWFWSGL